jgi:hypothetical protein
MDLLEIEKKFKDRETLTQFNQAIRARIDAFKENNIAHVQQAFVNECATFAVNHGFNAELKKIMTKKFDYGRRLGIAINCDMKRDEDAAFTIYLSNQYQELIRQYREKINKYQKLKWLLNLLEKIKVI